MGSVYKAVDLNLNREVALKILKKECSANAEERAKLEEEARIIASINHPHVVKVFSFGEDQGQFYLAMELAEKGSLDDLMSVQQRLSEAQVLRVGIQIAEGLDAALEHNLIHRDIKPGNILFADPHTAKLVDFGLAAVIDEVAHARGEIWGTPYYIAPEKLDNQPEDFRSDIYSLGGTLFHALAGRPPYEAETASTVALKQLMSQPVSLQTFAPDVSSETAYVINRMLAKDPAERYASYAELIEHLSFARSKLLERSKQPHKAKERVVIETQAVKNVSGLLSLGLVSIIFLACILVVHFSRLRFLSTRQRSSIRQPCWRALAAGISKRRAAACAATSLKKHLPNSTALPLSGDQQPLKNWIRMNGALAALVAGDSQDAVRRFRELANEEPYSTAEKERLLASFFVEASKQLAKADKPIPALDHGFVLERKLRSLRSALLRRARLGDRRGGQRQRDLRFFLSATLPRLKAGSTNSSRWPQTMPPTAIGSPKSRKTSPPRPERGIRPGFGQESACGTGRTQTRRRLAARLKSIEAELIAKGATP